MGYLVAFPTIDGAEVVVEVDEAPGTERVSRRGAMPKLEETVEAGPGTMRSATYAVLPTLDRLARKPDEATFESGVQLNAKVGAVIASSDAQSHLTVTLKSTRLAGPTALVSNGNV